MRRLMFAALLATGCRGGPVAPTPDPRLDEPGVGVVLGSDGWPLRADPTNPGDLDARPAQGGRR